ncbi:MAG: tRNA (adenosine(37)-N6)-threonylcarbamoyltransferase complex transferase subunit TsaD [Planctomycetota bacterium]|jgi:N6-L-threonylcarbamoyladenine synthase
MKRILTIESTCDETAAAVISEDLRVGGSAVASQDKLHERFSGVVPEIAARAHLERILPVIDEALRQAGCGLADLAAVAVATTPGLANSLLVGLSAAKAIALAQQIPLLGINHLHAHVYACRLAAGREIFPCVGLIISGGHTHLFHYRDPLDAKPLGGTIDDAAGEAFDKVATLLGLGYPGGPALSRLAESGDPQAIRFPRSFIHESRLDFSFSGLKTAVRYAISPQGSAERSIRDLAPRQLADIAASFELAVAETIAIKAGQAMSQTGERRLCVGGGVAANRVVRRELEQAATRLGFELLLAPRELCTDNAVMGAIAWEKYWRGQFDGLDLEIAPGLLR